MTWRQQDTVTHRNEYTVSWPQAVDIIFDILEYIDESSPPTNEQGLLRRYSSTFVPCLGSPSRLPLRTARPYPLVIPADWHEDLHMSRQP